MGKSLGGPPGPVGRVFFIDFLKESSIYGYGRIARTLVFGISVKITNWESGYGIPEKVYIVNSPKDHTTRDGYITMMLPVTSRRQKITKRLGLYIDRRMNFLSNSINNGSDTAIVTNIKGVRISDSPDKSTMFEELYMLTYGVDGPWYTATKYEKFLQRTGKTENIS